MTVDSFGVGRYIFMVASIPKSDVKYGEAAKEFMDYVGKAREDPSLTIENRGKTYIAVDNLVTAYRALIQQNTNQTMEQRIDLLPNPQADQVLVSF